MKAYFKSKLCMVTLCLPLMLSAESKILDNEFSLTGEKLLQSTVIELKDEPQVSENAKKNAEFSAQKQLEEAVKSNQDSNFLSHLQANMGTLQMPPAIQTGSDQTNTWIPKFVWLGDVQKDDDLKCFAAFLIGSLADSSDKSKPQSPGVFMTPVETASTHPKNDVANSQLQSNAGKSYDGYVARHGSMPPALTPYCSKMFCEIETGLGFLYFSGVKGFLNPRPQQIYQDIAGTQSTSGVHSFPIKGRLEHNRTPLYAVNFGWNLLDFLSFAVTMQAQQNLHIRTQPLQVANTRVNVLANQATCLTQVNFESFLNLYSIGGKLMFQWTDMVSFSSWGISLYVGGSCGAAWQNWVSSQATQTYLNNVGNVSNCLTNANISFRDKTFANFNYTGDAGLMFKPTNELAKLSFKMGCKFIGWGQTRGLGALKDQKDILRIQSAAVTGGSVPFPGPAIYPSYFKPIQIKAIYSWAPYIGFNWEF